MIEIIDELYKQHKKIIGVYSLFSGGHDSLVATHVASKHPNFSGVIHIDTGTGLKETRDFVIETCREHDWKLIIKRPTWNFEALLMRYGFPGPHMHKTFYNILKDRPLRVVTKEIKAAAGESKRSRAKIILISGARANESDRRAEITSHDRVEGVRVWCNLIVNMSAVEVGQYIKNNNLKRSPVKDNIHMSGECFCGAFARKSEYQELQMWYPYQADRINNWEHLVKVAAQYRSEDIKMQRTPESEALKPEHCKWGWKDGLDHKQSFMPMCFQCRGA